ncbi:MAG: hypothetical protein ACRDHZ_24725 [Ktedonobacteraceae bacterium]
MKFLRPAFIIIILSGLIGCIGAKSSSSNPPESRVASARNENAVLKQLRPVLKSAGKAARIYYLGACEEGAGTPMPFPEIDVQEPLAGLTGETAVRAIFRNDTDVSVTEGRSGIIAIKIGKLPTEILTVRMSELRLKPIEQYNPTLAIFAIENSKDVNAAMRQRNIQPVMVITDLGVVQPTKGFPHLPPSIRNATVDQALDTIAKTFMGIVLYGACDNQYLIEFGHVLPDFGGS